MRAKVSLVVFQLFIIASVVISSSRLSLGQAAAAASGQDAVDPRALLDLAKGRPSYFEFTTVKNNKGEYVNKRVGDDKRAGDDETAEAEKLIAQGADLNATDDAGATPLIAALSLKKLPLAKLLIEKGADVNAALNEQYGDDAGATALIVAASDGDVGIATLLISKGANLNATTRIGRAALHTAVCNNKLAMVALLIRSNADLSALDNEGKTALQIAREKKYAGIVALLNRPTTQSVPKTK